jgi:uncharacterized protein YneF (UPF0154 family)
MAVLMLFIIIPGIALVVFFLYLLYLCMKALQIYIRKNS